MSIEPSQPPGRWRCPVWVFGSALVSMSGPLLTMIVRDVHRGYIESIALYGFVLAIVMFLGAANLKKETPKDPRIHLSTAVILMLAAGVFLWLNLRDRNGWPIGVFTIVTGPKPIDRVDQISVTLDSAVAFFSLFAIHYLCERHIRKQAASKTSALPPS